MKFLLSSAGRSVLKNWSEQQFIDHVETLRQVDRRSFMKSIAAGLAATACQQNLGSDLLGDSKKGTGDRGSGFQVAILGAGLAGLSTAHYLAKAGIRSTIYEARPRIGGRVVTQKNFNGEGMFIEWGAEFVDSTHHHLIHLAHELGLPIQEFAEPIQGLEEEVYFFNNKTIDSTKFIPEFKKLAQFVIDDTRPIRKKGQLILPTFGTKNQVSWLDQISLAEYLEQKKNQGLSNEFVELVNVMYLGMLGLETTEQSVYNMLTLMDVTSNELGLYGDSDESKRVQGGNGNLVEQLGKSVNEHSNIQLGHQLKRISKSPAGAFILDFDRNGMSSVAKRADIVIVTIPIPVLKNIDGFIDLELSAPKKNAIKHLGYATNAKYSIGFTKRQWREKNNKIPPNYGTVWSNGAFPEIRDSSNNQPGKSGIILNYLSGKKGARIPPNLKNKTLEYLSSLYPGIENTVDCNDHLQHWVSEEFSKGSYICQKPKHYSLMAGFENQVELNSQMFFAGDSFSIEFGGYMNGAIETGKKAAELATKRHKS